MSHYNRDSEQPVFSFMDGVPVKISEQYKPPRKVGLPNGYQQRMSTETTNEEYDFKLEHSILQNIGEWRRLRKETVERRRERIETADAFEKQKNLRPESPMKQTEPTVTSPNAVSPNPNLTNSVSQSSAATRSFTSHNTSILKPMQIAQPTQEVHISQISQLNFSDFEADTSSPFDNMELKTINEMEVLAHVLQPLSNSPDSNRNTSCYGVVSTSCDTVEKSSTKDLERTGMRGYAMHNAMPRDHVSFHYSSNCTSQQPYYYYQNETLPVGDVKTTAESQEILIENLNRMSVSNSVPEGYTLNRFVQSHSIPIKNFTQTSETRQAEEYSNRILDSYNLASVSDMEDNDSVTFPPSNQGLDKTHSTSVPDLVQELEKELRMRRQINNLPPQRPNSFGSSGLENWSPWPTLESPQHTPSSSKQPTMTGAINLPPKSTLKNPFNELPSSEKRMTQHISEMGFSQARVARACKALGADERKVVEYLLQVQALESDGYPGDAAERALIANDYEQARTVEHLEAMKQLLDLGFKEEKISEALIRFDNDRDKALDHLIS